MMPKSNQPIHLLPITQDELLLEKLDAAVEGDDGFVLIDSAKVSNHILEDIAELQPDYIFLDCKNGYSDSIDLIDSISIQFPEVIQIAVISKEQLVDAGHVTLSGARAFMVQPCSPTEIINTLNRVSKLVSRTQISQSASAEAAATFPSRGTVCVFSPKGGAGCSSIAANLALWFNDQLKEEVLLIDGKLQFGHLDMMLNLRAQNTIADLVTNVENLDQALMRDLVTEHSSGLKVLPSPRTSDGDQSIHPDDLYKAMSSIQNTYPYIVIDAGNFLDVNTVILMDSSYKIVLVINPDLASLRDASQFLEICRTLSYPKEKVLVVVNRLDKREGLSLKDIERSLRIKVFGTIPWDRKDSLQNLSQGVPAVLQEKPTKLGNAFRSLAEDMLPLIVPPSTVPKVRTAEKIERTLKERWQRTFRALQNRDYRYFFIGQILSLVGTWMQIVAQGWLIYRLTDSPFMLGLVNLVGLLPVVPISLISGVISDRFSKRKIIIATEFIMMAQALAFAALIWFDMIAIWHVMVLSFVLGAAAALEQPARLSIIANLVGREDLTNAVALNAAIYNSARIIGPAIAGFIVAFWGEASCFLINGISYSGVIVALFLMKMPEITANGEQFRVGKQMMAGLKFIWEDKTIRALMTIVAYSSFLTLPYVALMPAFSKDVLQVGSEGLGILLTGIGIGALLGALWIAGAKSGRRGIWLTVGNILGPVLLILFTLSRSYVLSLLIVILIGGSNAIRQALANSLIQLSAKKEYHGRVMSVFNLLFNGMSRAGALVVGGLAEFTGISFALGAGGVAGVLFSLFIVWRMSYVHRIP